jgi:putative pyruvate formate lyase activating enzyme
MPTGRGDRHPEATELDRRLQSAWAGLRQCELCEIRCGADRLAGQRGPCGLDANSYVQKRHVSLAEEVELLPAYLIYLGGCNFRCRFCVQAPTCFDGTSGQRADDADIAAELAGLKGRGIKSVILIGGEPSLHPHAILALSRHLPRDLMLVLKTNMYMTPPVLDLLDGVVDLYLADYKFGSDRCAHLLAGMDRYTAVVQRNLHLAGGRSRVLVRHLLMPGHLDCCFKPVAAWVARNLPGVAFRLLEGYVPAWRAQRDQALGRLVARQEVLAAREYLRTLGWRQKDEVWIDQQTAATAVG